MKRIHAQDIGLFLLRFFETVVQIVVLILVGTDKIRRNIDDDALIDRVAVDHGAVDLSGFYKDHIIGLQLVRMPLDTVADISPDKDQDLVEIVVVKRKIFFLPVDDVEHFEVCSEITGFFVVFHM